MLNLPAVSPADVATAIHVLTALDRYIELEIKVQAAHGDTFACDIMHDQRADIGTATALLNGEI